MRRSAVALDSFLRRPRRRTRSSRRRRRSQTRPTATPTSISCIACRRSPISRGPAFSARAGCQSAGSLERARVPRSARGTLASLILSEPLIPGDGDGNTLEWPAGARPSTDPELQQAVWERVLAYLDRHAAILRVDAEELAPPRVGIFEDGALIQVFAQRRINGIPVRDSSVTAIFNNGNLVLLGLQNWGDLPPRRQSPHGPPSRRPRTLRNTLSPSSSRAGRASHPRVRPDGRRRGLRSIGWPGSSAPACATDLGTWEGLVDADSGELIAFEDRNQYAARKVIGGVYPVSNDQRPPDGVEQPGWPMPFANVATSAGNVSRTRPAPSAASTGTVTTALVGRYVRMDDVCGADNETSAAGDLDLGFGPDADRHRLHGARRPFPRRHQGLAHGLLRAEPHQRAGPRLPADNTWLQTAAASQHEHQPTPATPSGTARRSTSTATAAASAGTRASRRRSSTTSGATAWTTTASTPPSRPRRGHRRHPRLSCA